ncbi:MAG TPA: hypothetical protein VGJ70_06960, partial [Solirubrobacteraceae bacterium]
MKASPLLRYPIRQADRRDGQPYPSEEGRAIRADGVAQVGQELVPDRRTIAVAGCHQLDTPHDIRLVDLAKRYGGVRAVDGVSLDIARGEFF